MHVSSGDLHLYRDLSRPLPHSRSFALPTITVLRSPNWSLDLTSSLTYYYTGSLFAVHRYIFHWYTNLACLPEPNVHCRVDSDGSFYDLTPLQNHRHNWLVTDAGQGAAFR
jgi:hypothetical protein